MAVVLGTLWLLACTGAPEVDPVPERTPEPVFAPEPRAFTFEFNHLRVTDEVSAATQPTLTSWALVDKRRSDPRMHEIRRVGQDGFGARVRADGTPYAGTCDAVDFTGVVQAAGKAWVVSHLECVPGAISLTRVDTSAEGDVTPAASRQVDFAAVGGVWNPCAGQTTPWGTHLASEEYEPDAAGPSAEDREGLAAMAGYLPDGATPNPYAYGWIPEVTVLDAEGSTRVVKHKAPGRFSHEVAHVLPDERTVYLSDDGTGGGWFLFVADRPKDLSSGSLYAARFTQRSAAPLAADVAWIPLGHADNAYVDGLIAAGVGFADLFEKQDPADGVCAEGFSRVQADGLDECLKLKAPSARVADPARAASRLETRRLAGMYGAHTEIEKGEGVTFDPVSGRVYLAVSRIGGRLLDEGGGPADGLRLPENVCGGILSGPTGAGVLDGRGVTIDSAHVMTALEGVVVGAPQAGQTGTGTCLAEGIANPDNLAYLPGFDLLMIAEDTTNHPIPSLWALELRSMGFKRVLAAPTGGEVGGISWVSDLGGKGYLTVGVRQPTGDGISALIGPFPKLD